MDSEPLSAASTMDDSTSSLNLVPANSKKILVITKTALIEKNKKFVEYLISELKIMQKLSGESGIIKCLGIQSIKNQFNNNEVE